MAIYNGQQEIHTIHFSVGLSDDQKIGAVQDLPVELFQHLTRLLVELGDAGIAQHIPRECCE